jgi:hypothetical protein
MAFHIPSYRLGEQQSRGAAPSLQIDAPPAAFGAAGAQHLQEAAVTSNGAPTGCGSSRRPNARPTSAPSPTRLASSSC